MRLRNRFLLVGTGVIIFLIVTPILVLYARGFKIDWENRDFVKTGTLVIKTETEKGQIYLNDELYDSTTQANIRFLLPKDYNIRLEKDEYQSWTKRLSVKSQLVTWANLNRDFITLFLKQPILEQSHLGNDIRLIDNHLNFLENNQPTQININNGEVKEIQTLPSPPLTSDPTEEIVALLTSLNIPIPQFRSGEIIRIEGQIYLILDQTLYLVNDELEKIYAPVNYAKWDNDERKLIYSNDNEIYIYYADWKNSDLILRSLTPVKNPVINSTTGFIFFQNEGMVKTIEMDDRDHRNIFTLSEGLDNFVISDDGKKLFVYNGTEIKQYKIR
jgi:hypothetical protein